MTYIHCNNISLVILPTFLGFDTLWNTPLGKCYSGITAYLWIHL
jgi:hypothetical protein